MTGVDREKTHREKKLHAELHYHSLYVVFKKQLRRKILVN